MSGGKKCEHEKKHLRVTHRYHNHSAFNGYHKTSSDYSGIICLVCLNSRRAKGKWVDEIPDLKKGESEHYNFICK